jgi:ubiquinone/menaquinone biosynthesis C-methylase UbiE
MIRRPLFIAEQSRHARGWLGHLIARFMARETWSDNQRAITVLSVKPSDVVLDIGCGHGRSIAALASKAPQGRIVGTDPSELMCRLAAKHNSTLIRSGRVEIKKCDAARLPFASGSFDNALCVHVIYFWANISAALAEISRVLKPDACLALAFKTSADAETVRAFPRDIYRFPAFSEVIDAMGTTKLVLEQAYDVDQSRPTLLVARKSGD